jgi:hypothetical protein
MSKITSDMRRKAAHAYDLCYARPGEMDNVAWTDYKIDGTSASVNGFGYWVHSREEVVRMGMDPDADENFEFDGIVWCICPL